MTTGALIWISLFIAATVLFFALAAVISVMGFKDLKELLKKELSQPAEKE